MIQKWSWLNEAGTGIVRTETNGGSLMFSVLGIRTNNHPDSRLLTSGALPHVYPIPGQYQRLGDLVIEVDAISKELVDWSAEEIADAVILEEDNALLILLEASADLAFWADKTDEDITALVAATPNTFAGFRANDEKIAQAVGDIVKILRLLRNTGRLF